MPSVHALISEDGEVPALVEAILGTSDPSVAAARLERACIDVLGSEIADAEFLSTSVGVVLGARLADGRRVVLKLHLPRVSVAFLEAVRCVQRALRDDGFPAPEPLASPAAWDAGTFVVESLEDVGEHVDARAPGQRRVLASGLAELVRLAEGFVELPGLAENPLAVSARQLFPEPHNARFDFATPGGEWIDAIARRAKPLREAGRWVVGHCDWRTQHVRIDRGRLTAVYDWDSLTVTREPIVAGQAAHAYTIDWDIPDRQQMPDRDEALGFIDDYETARGTPFTAAERRAAHAALIWVMAYTARCEHSDDPTTTTPPPGSARAFLTHYTDEVLGE